MRRRLPAVAAYVAGVLAVALGTSGVWNSKYQYRLQLPALVIACVVAAPALARLPAPYRSIVLAVVADCWFSAFALTRYSYAI